MICQPDPAAVARRLKERFGDWDHHNRSNPFDELLFIICSTKTDENGYRTSFAALKREFPTFGALAEAPARLIAKPLVRGGLYRSKSRAIRRICESLVRRFGRATLAPLKDWPDRECEAFLTSLAGVGLKVARCVMMYSLGRQVFPVDTHCWKIARRLGWVRATKKGGVCSNRDMDRLQAKIPAGLRFSLHVNMVSLGRHCCRARDPLCQKCPLDDVCPKIGVLVRRRPTRRGKGL